MATVREQLTQARELIQQQRHDEARSLLVTIDHPKAYEWLEQLDARFPVKKQTARNRGAALPPPADPFASVAERTPERTAGLTPISADNGNAGITFVTVFLGGFIAVAVAMLAMLLADSTFDIHPYFMGDPRRLATLTGGFALVSTVFMCFIARLFGDAHNLFIGIYYALLGLILLVGWHYSSYHMHWGDGLASMLSPDGITAYINFLSTIPAWIWIAYGIATVVTLTVSFPFGAMSDEELRRRVIERNKNK